MPEQTKEESISRVPVRLPNNSQRLAVVGRTGSGKTVASLWHLSKQNFDLMPWVIIDFKTDTHINDIELAQHVELGFVPSKPGIYVVHPLPSDAKPPRPAEQSNIEKYLWQLWHKENVGIFVDEGYMLGNDSAFEACLTQGRSKLIPMIVCTQRPAWISRFVFSEADFYEIFHLNDERDRKTVESFVPYDSDDRLDDYHSWYYDVGRDSLVLFKPVPETDKILSEIHQKLLPLYPEGKTKRRFV